eukprot:gene9449-1655_t
MDEKKPTSKASSKPAVIKKPQKVTKQQKIASSYNSLFGKRNEPKLIISPSESPRKLVIVDTTSPKPPKQSPRQKSKPITPKQKTKPKFEFQKVSPEATREFLDNIPLEENNFSEDEEAQDEIKILFSETEGESDSYPIEDKMEEESDISQTKPKENPKEVEKQIEQETPKETEIVSPEPENTSERVLRKRPIESLEKEKQAETMMKTPSPKKRKKKFQMPEDEDEDDLLNCSLPGMNTSKKKEAKLKSSPSLDILASLSKEKQKREKEVQSQVKIDESIQELSKSYQTEMSTIQEEEELNITPKEDVKMFYHTFMTPKEIPKISGIPKENLKFMLPSNDLSVDRLLNIASFGTRYHRNAYCMIKNEVFDFSTLIEILHVYGWNENTKEEEKVKGVEKSPPKENFGNFLNLLSNSIDKFEQLQKEIIFDFLTDCLLTQEIISKLMESDEFASVFIKKFPILNEYVIKLIFQLPQIINFTRKLCEYYLKTSIPTDMFNKIVDEFHNAPEQTKNVFMEFLSVGNN